MSNVPTKNSGVCPCHFCIVWLTSRYIPVYHYSRFDTLDSSVVKRQRQFSLTIQPSKEGGHSGIDEPSLSTVHATLIWIEQPTDRNTHTDLLNYGVCIYLSSLWFDGCHGNRTTLFIVSPLSKCLALSFQLFPIRLCLPHVCVYAIMGNKVMHRSMWS